MPGGLLELLAPAHLLTCPSHAESDYLHATALHADVLYSKPCEPLAYFLVASLLLTPYTLSATVLGRRLCLHSVLHFAFTHLAETHTQAPTIAGPVYPRRPSSPLPRPNLSPSTR